jgi:hypothetical protein
MMEAIGARDSEEEVGLSHGRQEGCREKRSIVLVVLFILFVIPTIVIVVVIAIAEAEGWSILIIATDPKADFDRLGRRDAGGTEYGNYRCEKQSQGKACRSKQCLDHVRDPWLSPRQRA